MKVLFLILLLGATGSSLGQSIHSVSKLEGTWNYIGGTGFERWRVQENELIGEAFRFTALGDTLLTERMRIASKNGKLVLEISPQTAGNESHTMWFEALKKKYFLNLSDASPYAIEYRLGFLAKRRLKIRVYYGMKSEPYTFILRKN